jgi:hypothetical protein
VEVDALINWVLKIVEGRRVVVVTRPVALRTMVELQPQQGRYVGVFDGSAESSGVEGALGLRVAR